MKTKEIIQKLINGEMVNVPDSQKKEVQKALRAIKANCTAVLSQMK